jgi:phosphomannomutase
MIQQQVFKANDIRGLVIGDAPEWDLDGARALGAAFVTAFDLAGSEFVLGRDMRVFGRELSLAFAEGARRLGADVVDVGLVSTDELWYASGVLGIAGVQFTASHNPAGYNGIKFCLPHAAPITPDLMAAIVRLSGEPLPSANAPGSLRELDVLPGYARHLHQLVDLTGLRPLKVVVDAGNGMAGHTTPAVLAPLVEVVGLYLDLDGTFPNHPANPLEPANLVDAQAAVLAHAADLGFVFDGDADRCFIIDERGDVVFGGEHSAHYYFRDFWGADTGMLAALHILALVGRAEAPMSQLGASLPRYASSGEINTTVVDPRQTAQRVAAAFEGLGAIDWVDGLKVRGDGWWVSVRSSNTEPLLRLNVEARDAETMASLRDRALAIIREEH